jgi:hypothetical protein
MPDDVTQTRPDAAVMRGVIPYVGLKGRAAEAMDFYAAAFGATDIGRMPDAENPARLMHGQLEINGGALMITDMGCEDGAEGGVGSTHMQLVFGNGRAGGTARSPPAARSRCPTSDSSGATTGARCSTRSGSDGRCSSPALTRRNERRGARRKRRYDDLHRRLRRGGAERQP